MNKKIIIPAIVIVVVAIVGAAVAYGAMRNLSNTNESGNQTEAKKPLTEKEQILTDGIEAENNGDTKVALKNYKKARELCADDNTVCIIDMDMKIDMMEKFLKQETATKK